MASFTAANQGNAIFSPAIWSKEMVIARESMLLMANNILRLDSDVAENGYQINVPTISNLTASLIGADGSIADQAPTETVTQINISQWWGLTINIPDILAVQSRYELLRLYAEKMGYALGVTLEDLLIANMATNAANSVGTYGTDFTDANIRRAIQYLDDARVPQSERHFLVAPKERNNVLGLDKFVRYDAVSYKPDESPIVKGNIGYLYGVEFHVSPEITVASGPGYDNIANGGLQNLMFHKEAEALAMQKDIKVEKFARTNFSDRMGASELFGYGTLRTDHIVLVES